MVFGGGLTAGKSRITTVPKGRTVLFAASSFTAILGGMAALQAGVVTEGAHLQLIKAGDKAATGVSYRATRRLEAWSVNGDARGWLQAETEFDPKRGLRFTIVQHGGSSDRIQNKVLPQILEAEQDAWAKGEFQLGALTPQNYSFGDVQGNVTPSVIGVRLRPLRRERVLVDGTAWLQQRSAQLLRVEGQLAKSPSFWISRVDIDRRFECVAGHVLPVAVDSTAHIRMAGPYKFQMTYQYERVDGHAVSPALRSAC